MALHDVARARGLTSDRRALRAQRRRPPSSVGRAGVVVQRSAGSSREGRGGCGRPGRRGRERGGLEPGGARCGARRPMTSGAAGGASSQPPAQRAAAVTSTRRRRRTEQRRRRGARGGERVWSDRKPGAGRAAADRAPPGERSRPAQPKPRELPAVASPSWAAATPASPTSRRPRDLQNVTNPGRPPDCRVLHAQTRTNPPNRRASSPFVMKCMLSRGTGPMITPESRLLLPSRRFFTPRTAAVTKRHTRHESGTRPAPRRPRRAEDRRPGGRGRLRRPPERAAPRTAGSARR